MSPRVALYWDFENLHASLVDEKFGEGEYRRSQYQAQESLIDIEAIVDLARDIGPLSVHRAYGNWQSFRRYRRALLSHAVDLIQLFHLGPNAKNGADIRLALDALDDLWRFQGITHLIVVGGDSDYIPLAQKARQMGRVVIGIGAKNSTNTHWARVCDKFHFYRDIATEISPEPTTEDVMEELRYAPDASNDYEASLAMVGVRLPSPSLRREALRRMLLVFQTSPGGLIYDFSDIDERATKGGEPEMVAPLLDALRTLRRSFYALYMFEMHGRGNGIGLKFSDGLGPLLQAYADRLAQRLQRVVRRPLDAQRIAELIDGPEGAADPEVVALVAGVLTAYS